VNHENFRGSWYLSYSNSDSAYSVEKAYPFGSSVTVYYNPKDPTDSVLLLGPDEAGINALFMGAGANLLWLWLLMACWGCDWPGKPMPVAGGVTIISRMMETRVRLPRFRPLDMGMLALGLLLLGGGFIVPSYVEADGLALAICGGFGIATIGGAAVYLAFLLIVLSGRQDLIIKQAERVLELPSTNGRWKRMTVPFSEITSVTLERVPQALGGRTFYSNVPTLDIRGRPPQRLTVFVVEARGQAFISWLQDKLDFEMGSEPDWEPGLEHVSSLQCRSAAKHPAEGE